MDSSDSSLPSPIPKSTPATLRRYSQSRRPRRRSPLLAARRCCAALLRRPTPPTRLHRHRHRLPLAFFVQQRSPPAHLRSQRSQVVLPQVFLKVKFRPGRGSASAWDKISFVVMPPLLQSAQLKPDVTITSADNEIDESDDDRPVSSLDHCSVNKVFLLSLELEFICIGAMCEIDLCVVPMRFGLNISKVKLNFNDLQC
nr:importin-5-like [Ipomoea batatas]